MTNSNEPILTNDLIFMLADMFRLQGMGNEQLEAVIQSGAKAAYDGLSAAINSIGDDGLGSDINRERALMVFAICVSNAIKRHANRIIAMMGPLASGRDGS